MSSPRRTSTLPYLFTSPRTRRAGCVAVAAAGVVISFPRGLREIRPARVLAQRGEVRVLLRPLRLILPVAALHELVEVRERGVLVALDGVGASEVVDRQRG